MVDISNDGSDDQVYFLTAAVVVTNTAAQLQARCDLLQVDVVAGNTSLASSPVTVPSGAPGAASAAHAMLLGWVVVPAASSKQVTVGCINGGIPVFSATITAMHVSAIFQ